MGKKKTISVLCALALVANLLVGASAFAGQDEAVEDSLGPTAPLEEAVDAEGAEDAVEAAGPAEETAEETAEEAAPSPKEDVASVDEEAEDGGLSPLSILLEEIVASFIPQATDVTLLGAEAVAVPGTADVANYVVLSVSGDDSSVAYRLDGSAATPSAVYTDGASKVIKLAVPAGTSGTVTVTSEGADTDVSGPVTIATAGVAAPDVLYGATQMAFSEFFYDVTAGIADVQPATTSFAAAGAVAAPEPFIAQGTRSGELYPGNITWAASSGQPAVDAVSTATFGDGGVHYSVSKAVATNYDDDINSTGEGHALTGIRSVDVAVSFDLLANATLLDALGEATAQSSAVLGKAANVAWADASGIYKPKHLFADASWGARADTALNAAGKSFPALAEPTTSYGGNWTTKQYTVNFNLAAQGIGAEAFWDDYLEYIYGGYIENTATGEREPLVWLQNLFSHRMHQNFDVSINDSIFPRFGSFTFPGDFKIVVFAEGFEDIVLEGVHLGSYINGDAAIEQGTTFNVDPAVQSTWFENAQLHIQGAAVSYAATAKLYKGNEEVSSSLYYFEEDNGEIALNFQSAFFTGDFQGSYTARLVPDTDDVKSKPLTFTVNKLVAWPTLSVEDGAQNVASAKDEATPLSVPVNKKVTLGNADLAKTFIVSGRGASTIQDLTDTNATVTVTNVIKRDSTADPYYLDFSTLTVGHTYRLSLATTNYSVATATTPTTTLSYYVTVVAAQAPGPQTVTDPATGITVSAAAGIPLDELEITEITNLAVAGLSWLKHTERDLSAAYDIHFASYELAQGETITISFPLKQGVAEDGDKVLVHHGHDVAGKRYAALEPVAANGRIEVTVSSLSPFALHEGETGTDGEEETREDTGTENKEDTGSKSDTDSESDTDSTIPDTGDSNGSQMFFAALLFMALGALGLFGAYLRRDTDPRFKPIPRRKNS
ncbi:MAG: hypothetical protein LBC23_01875 [Coriobacteriales bacterium]|jgi:hypothetical protein|nr:hypothetical protein [Coriobacteriales bacterium]